ncbi:flagellar protein FlaG [Desulfallas thermosapovorans]|uniref:Flagellar protein FlaG n=1 Tax=Desulfallas thermosapovorans DSM 6562 TaxID=1121431 RepID=A0A5S4ZRX2_9FIRM|nr:flagellar protein FlaG [Desulfallas thermosapovorans]TYO95491.1 flagellar protein FlaG [Desulfallas thermosapovorans DSM 6562]
MRITGADAGVINNINTYKTPPASERQQDGLRLASEGLSWEKKVHGGTRFGQGDLEEAISQLNDTMDSYTTGLRFELHEKSGEIMVKVINVEDDTVIREIPPEKVLDMVAYFKRVLGIIVDELI